MRYALQRIAQFAIVFVIVTFVVMVATRIGSSDPVRDLAGGTVSDEVIEKVRADYPYLDRNIFVQYFYWLKDMLTGDFGYSYAQSQSVADMFRQRLPASFFIGFWAILLGLLVAVPLGVYAAYRRDGLFDRSTSLVSFAFISVPPLVFAVLLLLFVAVRFETFPVLSVYVAPWDNPWDHFRNFLLPSLTLALGLAAVWSRFLRADMISTLQSDFIMLARAKGMSPKRILWGHALRASILSLVTSVALQLSGLVGGAVIAEQFFGPKGIGDRLVFAVQQNDLLVIQAVTALLVVVVVTANLLVDLLYAVIDPRIRHARALG
ncbi:MAG: ABC transporter permease [Ilumatobacteraceae bacterium]|nr:MAG: ABC transporter permease [Actinomycetota bacterium]